ncbi:MAG: ImmA/IrrE family metallo-endopeptidase [Desulfobacteraceae bacterium]|nr:ImmA/IrrE family metallo-endopeptidase [Desulfobacteraceae bacterium]MBC2754331.1 ImmA/IrrE family metallo-endopeptidase [Desulfobacteraceae bacterium]
MNKTEKMAQQLLAEFGIDTPPVPVEDIAKQKGAKLSFEPFEGKDDISGLLFRDKNNVIIGINSAHPRNRQRFSIAHELGHLFLHDKELFVDKVVKLNFRDSVSSAAIDTKEIAANAFAAELLMPKQFIQNEIYKIIKKSLSLNKEELIEKLAVIFEVSKQAMEYRLTNLGILHGQ